MSVNVLISYAFHSKTDLAVVRRDLVCGNLMIDSGAFTAYSVGQKIELGDYARYLEQWDGFWDHAITLDVIGSPRRTRQNTIKLHAKGLRVMPVFTRGETLREFDAMVKECGYVCVGGGVGMGAVQVQERLAMLQRRAADAGGGVHALGMGSVPHTRAVMPYSADSSNVSNTFRYGTIRYWDGKAIAWLRVSDKIAMRKHWAALRAHDIDVAKLASTGKMPLMESRHTLVRSMGLAYACADEWLHHIGAKVVIPHSIRDVRTGPHLYSSIVGSHLLPGTVELDRMLHNGYRPPVWAQFAAGHVCGRRMRHAS